MAGRPNQPSEGLINPLRVSCSTEKIIRSLENETTFAQIVAEEVFVDEEITVIFPMVNRRFLSTSSPMVTHLNLSMAFQCDRHPVPTVHRFSHLRLAISTRQLLREEAVVVLGLSQYPTTLCMVDFQTAVQSHRIWDPFKHRNLCSTLHLRSL
jgi:hypothetical protein